MRKKKSAILEAVHETAKGLFDAGVMDKITLRKFDRLCFTRIIKTKSGFTVSIR
jgi:putative transcriptional regulator